MGKRIRRSPSSARTPAARAASVPPTGGARQPTEYTVSQVVRIIRSTLEDRIAPLWVAAEISNLSRPRSGHVYMTLKDASSQLAAVIWRPVRERIRFELADGLAVRVFGRITVYEPRGQVQLIVEQIEPKGLGPLELAFRQMYERLKAQGLFAPERKRPIPFLPRAIGIVTSPTGAALQDMLNVIYTRFPRAHVVIRPVRVQGEGAAQEIADAIDAFSRTGGVDVMIVGRGGGSLEDLWAFNEEAVARAVHASRIPVISAVGHEIDVSICDLVADLRALTPTDAASKVVPVWDELIEALRGNGGRMDRAVGNALGDARERLDALLSRRVLADPMGPVLQHQQRLDELSGRVRAALRFAARGSSERVSSCARRLRIPIRRISDARERLEGFKAAMVRSLAAATAARVGRLHAANGKLATLSPLAVLARGYSITTTAGDGRALTDAAGVRPGTLLATRLHRGGVISRATEIMEKSDGEEKDGRQAPEDV